MSYDLSVYSLFPIPYTLIASRYTLNVNQPRVDGIIKPRKKDNAAF